MKKIYFILQTLLLMIVYSGTALALSSSEVYEKANQSTFLIYGYEKSNDNQKATISGSGIAISQNMIITNCHVVIPMKTIKVKVRNQFYVGHIAYRDQSNDLCLVFVPHVTFHPVAVRSLDTLRVGEDVFAVGSPAGLENLISRGIISGIKSDGGKTLITTDAFITGGSSGGGLFDINANLIGITTAKYNGIAIALPVNWVIDLIPALTIQKTKTIVKTQSLPAAPYSKKVITKKLSNKPNHAISLYRYKGKCFIVIPGKNSRGEYTSRALWYPEQPNVVFFAAGSLPIKASAEDINNLLQSKNVKYVKTDSSIKLKHSYYALWLAKAYGQNEYSLLAYSDDSLRLPFMKEDNFYARFYNSNRSTSYYVKYSLDGFTSTYYNYMDRCK